MRYGLYAMNYGSCAEPDNVVRVAAHAEAAGFESLWTGEHFALPDPKPDWFTMEPTLPYLDAIVALTLMATHTETIKIAAGVFELPLHSPVMLAKQLTSIDRVSSGRLLAGVGAGYLEAEYAAFGVPLSQRGSRTDEYIDAMRALWTMPAPEYRGRHVTITGVDSHPRPVQPGGPPIIVGGLSDAARHRAVTRGNGWFVYDTDAEWVRNAVTQVADESEQMERGPELGRLELTVIPVGTFDRRTAEEYEAAGTDRVVLTPQHDLPLDRRHESVAVDQILRMIDRFAAQLLDRPSSTDPADARRSPTMPALNH